MLICGMERRNIVVGGINIYNMEYIKDLEERVIDSFIPLCNTHLFSMGDWEQFYEEEIDNIKKFILSMSISGDRFCILDVLTNSLATDDIFTFDDAISFVRRQKNDTKLQICYYEG